MPEPDRAIEPASVTLPFAAFEYWVHTAMNETARSAEYGGLLLMILHWCRCNNTELDDDAIGDAIDAVFARWEGKIAPVKD